MIKKITTDFKDFLAFKKAFELAMEIFAISKKFPGEEIYSLTDQIRRSSRSVCANIAEAYRKRRYPSHFVTKLTDCDMENSDTQVWLLFVKSCAYISEAESINLNSQSLEVGKLLSDMISHPEKYLPSQNKK